MRSEDKKEEIRDTADIVEVVGDYVRLKKSGSGFVGLCPFHDEKTPSFHVTPRLGIYKCFGCGASGDVFSFIMEMEGVSFPEALQTLADRYGIDLPEYGNSEEHEEETKKREGIYHALKFAGLFYHRQLHENDEASAAREYLDKRGYDEKTIRKFGLGYAPGGGSQFLKAATAEGIKEEFLFEADLIKKSNRGDGYYDTFRDRLIFPIFNPSGKVIAFAGRILSNSKKTAKYVNSAQTPVYNKSEVVYGLNFSKNDIRRQEEVILVEGYTDVITLHQHDIKNVVSSSGTSLTSQQINILRRYGNKITMLYDSDEAGQTAMDRGIKIALKEGMEVDLLELPEGEDPDSFVKQFGRDSFRQLKKEKSEDFVTFTIHKSEKSGSLEKPGDRARLINKILEQIAEIPDEIQRQVYVQHLHQQTQKYRKGSDRELFQQLDKLIAEKKKKDIRRANRLQHVDERSTLPLKSRDSKSSAPKKDLTIKKEIPEFEKYIIRLLLENGENMQRFIGHNIGVNHFESDQIRLFYDDIMKRHVKGYEISVKHYSTREDPFPSLLSDIMIDSISISNNRNVPVEQFKNSPFKLAKSSIKSLMLNFYKTKLRELSESIKYADSEKKKKLTKTQKEVNRQIAKYEKNADEIFENPKFANDKLEDTSSSNIFEYKMKHERD